MATKTKSKSTAAKVAMITKAKSAPAKQAKGATPEAVSVGECPKGGDHEWGDEDGDRHCAKCLEPAPAPTQQAKGTVALSTKKLSAMAAAAKLLGETGEPLNCKQLIEAIAAKG